MSKASSLNAFAVPFYPHPSKTSIYEFLEMSSDERSVEKALLEKRGLRQVHIPLLHYYGGGITTVIFSDAICDEMKESFDKEMDQFFKK